jgi:hypothetical protein
MAFINAKSQLAYTAMRVAICT